MDMSDKIIYLFIKLLHLLQVDDLHLTLINCDKKIKHSRLGLDLRDLTFTKQINDGRQVFRGLGGQAMKYNRS